MQVNDRTILLVDDNENDVFLTERALQRSKVVNRIVVATGGEEALDYLFCRGAHAGRDPEDMPVVVLLDLKMPRVDGMEVLKQVRENPRTRYLPVVILTSSKEDSDIVRGYALGCNAYVTKPVDFDQFQNAAVQLGLFWVLLNELPLRTAE